jgi:hypothetical protein
MDIGGFEIEHVGPVEVAEIERLLKALARHWPEGVLESGGGMPLGELVRDEPMWRYALYRGLDELFVYNSEKAHESWSEAGLTEQYTDQMIQLLWWPDSLTVVVDNADSESAHLVRGLLAELWPEVV